VMFFSILSLLVFIGLSVACCISIVSSFRFVVVVGMKALS
jgi:hypothetical protein